MKTQTHEDEETLKHENLKKESKKETCENMKPWKNKNQETRNRKNAQAQEHENGKIQKLSNIETRNVNLTFIYWMCLSVNMVTKQFWR